MWQLKYVINGRYGNETWQSQESAIARREQLLRDRQERIPGGKVKTVIQTGWTAITRKR